ncbi:MAG: hypothetical protein Q9221_002010 [Calogaya cf. arnoldii]
MEPLSIAASLLTVLEATAVVSKATISLYRNVRDAPKELECLANHISRTRVRLDGQVQLYQGLNSGTLAKWILDEALEAFHADLENAKACLESVQDIVLARSNHSNSKHRFSWVAQDKRKVNKLLGTLRDIDNKLSAMLHTMSFSRAISLRTNQLIQDLNTNQLYVAAQPLCSSRTMGIPPAGPLTVTHVTPLTTSTQIRAHGADIVRHARTTVQSSITMGRQTDELRSISWMIGLFRLPGLLSSYAVCITIQLWLFRLSWPCFKHSWAFKEILPRDSLFVKACIGGNVEEVKQLALSGKGMPSSIDEVGKPMLHGAFLEHTDLGGRTALTMLWYQPSAHFSRTDFLKLLLAYSPMPSVFDLSEAVGPFACAAMKGKVEDLELLIHTGLGMNCNDRAATRTVKYSIFGSNLATYEYLVPRLPRGWVHDVDQMGRGPLHIALEWSGDHVEEIVRSLIDRGADVHLIDLNGNNPGDVARIRDEGAAFDLKHPGNVQKYFYALRSYSFDVELDQDDNLWWQS